jgi:hypothetical protein
MASSEWEHLVAEFKERFVLKPDYALSELRRVAWDLDWDIVDFRREEAGAFVDIWTTYDKRTEVHYVDDQPIGMRYLTLRGEGSGETAEQIREKCDLWALSEARQALRVATDRNDKLVALYAAALTAPDAQDDSLVGDFRAVIHDPDAGVRQAVLIATGYLPWPGLVELVAQLRDNDPVEQVRENAGILLDGLREHGSA